MNDKELLMMAAKAAGFETKEDKHSGEIRIKNGGIWPCWNPLKDDGNALALAVMLKLEPVFHKKNVECYCCGSMIKVIEQDYGDDPYAATRRAIVRAAAEIGSKL